MRDKKPKKPRAKKYETKLAVNASFDEILTGMLSNPKSKRQKPVQKRSKKKE